eukprot:2795364-Rhodomonas_salina.1
MAGGREPEEGGHVAVAIFELFHDEVDHIPHLQRSHVQLSTDGYAHFSSSTVTRALAHQPTEERREERRGGEGKGRERKREEKRGSDRIGEEKIRKEKRREERRGEGEHRPGRKSASPPPESR